MNQQQREAWMSRLQGLSPRDQVIGYWLAHQADEDGVVDSLDRGTLAAQSGVTRETAWKALLPEEPLVALGHVIREDRQVGKMSLAPLLTLRLPDPQPG